MGTPEFVASCQKRGAWPGSDQLVSEVSVVCTCGRWGEAVPTVKFDQTPGS